MDLFGINIFNLIHNPAGAISTLAIGLLAYKSWQLLNSIFRPISYVSKLYDIADRIVERADNTIIDKIRNKRIKKDIQRQLKEVLTNRKCKIDKLICKVDD
jgi:hypothetical protein